MTTTGIPAKLHFIFLSKTETIPAAFAECHQRAKELHPAWEIKLYNEDDARDILCNHLPELWPVYNSYRHNVQKSDILRVVLVYLFGGFYLDMDMFCLKSLDELRDQELVLSKERLLSEDEMNHMEARHSFRIGNYMFGGIAKHPFWLTFLKASLKLATRQVNYENDIIQSTGPELLTNVYHSHKTKYRNITVLGNIDRRCLNSWHEAISCHFGNFAAHLHTGSWRWNGKKSLRSPLEKLPDKDYASAGKAIDSLLKITQPPADNLLLMETVIAASHRNLKGLYEKCRAICKKVIDTKNITGKNILLFGDPIPYKNKLSLHNNNILYTIPNREQIGHEWLNCLHQWFHSCIVPNEPVKQSLLSAGVQLPITVIDLGFQRTIRNFEGDDNAQENHFTIAFTDVENKQDLEKVIISCEAARQHGIPNIRLLLITNSIAYKKELQRNKAISTRKWIQPEYLRNVFITKFDGIHGFIFLNSDCQWSIGPRDILYQGIPSIIADLPVYHALVNSGYYPVIQAPANAHEVEQAILNLFHHYMEFNESALEGSRWIEDKWHLEFTANEVVKYVNSRQQEPASQAAWNTSLIKD